MAKTLAHVLRSAREAAELSQSALAERVGLASNHIARLESGDKLAPRFETVAKLAAALGLSLDEIAQACGYRSIGASARDTALPAIILAANRVRNFREASAAADVAAQSLLDALDATGGAPRRPKDPAGRRRPGKPRP